MEQYLRGWQQHWEDYGFGCGMLVSKSGGELLGTSGLFMSKVPDEVALEIGFMLLPQFRRLGYATEITEALVRFAFTSAGASRVVADPHKDHVASNRIFENLGFRVLGEREASLPEFPFCTPQRVWELNKPDWVKMGNLTRQ